MIRDRISQRKTREEKQSVTLRLRIYIDNAVLLSEKMENYDICLNMSALSEEECVELLMKLAE